MSENHEEDASHIRETEFPIPCDRCGCLLTGLGETGVCPDCGLAFHRHQRLWQVYGPEAFAKPPVRTEEYEPTWTGSAFVAGTLFGLLLAAVLPVAVWVARDWLGVADPWFVLFAWAVLATAVLWLVVSRYRTRADPDRGSVRPRDDGRSADAALVPRSDSEDDAAGTKTE